MVGPVLPQSKKNKNPTMNAREGPESTTSSIGIPFLIDMKPRNPNTTNPENIEVRALQTAIKSESLCALFLNGL